MTDRITSAELDALERQWESLHPMASDISAFGTKVIARVRELEAALRALNVAFRGVPFNATPDQLPAMQAASEQARAALPEQTP
jgi:hypothetical protein